MSLSQKGYVNCPECSHKNSVTVWQSLNVDRDPETREKLFNSEINTFRCQSCGTTNPISIPLMYHDMTRRFVVNYYPVSEIQNPDFMCAFDGNGLPRVAAESVQRLPESVRATQNLEYMQSPHVVFDMTEMIRYIFFREMLFELHRIMGKKRG